MVEALLHNHEEMEATLEVVTSAAFRLALNPQNRDAEAQCAVIWRFIHREVLPHLTHEERHLFPEAMRQGVAPEVVGLLRSDHDILKSLIEQLRVVGMVEGAESLTDEAATLLSRFFRMLEWHIAREELLLKQAVAQLPARVA